MYRLKSFQVVCIVSRCSGKFPCFIDSFQMVCFTQTFQVYKSFPGSIATLLPWFFRLCVDDDDNIQTVREGTAELRGKSRRVERVKITNHCIPEPGPVCKYGTIILLCFRKLLQFQTVVIHFRCIYSRHISTQKGRRFWRVLRDTSMKLGGRHKKETSG